jgi:hypothetical protein
MACCAAMPGGLRPAGSTWHCQCFAVHTALQNVAMYDLRPYDKPPGDSFLFSKSTVLLTVSMDALPLILYVRLAPLAWACCPGQCLQCLLLSVHMLLPESGGARSLDFSSDGCMLGASRASAGVAILAWQRGFTGLSMTPQSRATCVVS